MILAFDTATDQLTVALGTSAIIAARFHEHAPRAHLNRLLPVIDDLLHEAGQARSDIDAVAVGIGPGSFTGLRIGVATGQGLARALNKPLVGISTLDIIAKGTALTARPLTEGTRIQAVLDAKRQEVYTAEYRFDGDRIGDHQVMQPAALKQQLAETGKTILLTGDGLQQYGDELASFDGATCAPETLWTPDAAVLIKLAEERIERAGAQPVYRVLPLYIRLSDAEENRKRQKPS